MNPLNGAADAAICASTQALISFCMNTLFAISNLRALKYPASIPTGSGYTAVGNVPIPDVSMSVITPRLAVNVSVPLVSILTSSLR